SRQRYYEFYIDLLMRLQSRQPSAGFDGLAIEASERARARSMLGTLTEAKVEIREGIDPTLLEHERTLEQRLNAREASRLELLSTKHTEEQATAAKKEIEALLNEYQEVQDQIRQASPRYAALTQPEPLSLKQLQQILDEETLLLEYSFGTRKSYLWAVTRNS